jgi:hypothetical protein
MEGRGLEQRIHRFYIINATVSTGIEALFYL